MDKPNKSAIAFLESVSVKELAPVSIISVPSDTTAAAALKILASNNILSAPIYDASKNAYIGLIDMLDLVTFVVDVYKELQESGEASDFFSLLEAGEKFMTKDVKTVSDLSHRNPFIPVQEDANLYVVLKLFGDMGLHRLPVVDSKGHVVNLITQSAVVSFLSQNMASLGDIVQRTVKDLKLGSKGVLSVNIESRAVDAFKLLAEQRVNAVSVVDDDGRLISNISARDIRSVSTDERIIQNLFTPIRHFLQKIYSARLAMEKNPGISCMESDVLGHIIQKLAISKVHRVYIIDDRFTVMGVITLTDVLVALT